MSEDEKELLAKIVEGLLSDPSQPKLYKSGLLNAAYIAGIAQRLPGWTENQPASSGD